MLVYHWGEWWYAAADAAGRHMVHAEAIFTDRLPVLSTKGLMMSGEDQVHDGDAGRDNIRQSQPGGMAASGEQSEGGGEGEQSGRTHTGWGPADGELADQGDTERGDHRDNVPDAKGNDTRKSQPGGMAASGAQSEGGGEGDESGRAHTGWGPADGELADKETTHHVRPGHEHGRED